MAASAVCKSPKLWLDDAASSVTDAATSSASGAQPSITTKWEMPESTSVNPPHMTSKKEASAEESASMALSPSTTLPITSITNADDASGASASTVQPLLRALVLMPEPDVTLIVHTYVSPWVNGRSNSSTELSCPTSTRATPQASKPLPRHAVVDTM